jgi:hypothetical protein
MMFPVTVVVTSTKQLGANLVASRQWRHVDRLQLSPRGNGGILFPELAIFLQLIADNWPIATIITFTWKGSGSNLAEK